MTCKEQRRTASPDYPSWWHLGILSVPIPLFFLFAIPLDYHFHSFSLFIKLLFGRLFPIFRHTQMMIWSTKSSHLTRPQCPNPRRARRAGPMDHSQAGGESFGANHRVEIAALGSVPELSEATGDWWGTNTICGDLTIVKPPGDFWDIPYQAICNME